MGSLNASGLCILAPPPAPAPFPRGNVEAYKSILHLKYQLEEVPTAKVNYKPVRNTVNFKNSD